MLTMAQVNSIREMFFEKGKNYADIAKATGHDVKTVKKYISKDDFNPELPKVNKKRSSKLDQYKATIDQWLEADKLEHKKQRHTAKRVFKRLGKLYGPDFDCSYRLVALYVAERKKELYQDGRKFYLPLEHIAGEAQFDFGEAYFFEKNLRIKGHYLNLSFPHSNGGYTQLFKGENMQCLAEGLINIFAHIGYVPHKIWFDNLSPAVKKILKNHERELTEPFLRFKNHFGFATVFCNVQSGNEKGHVENKVGYHRRNLFVPPPRVDDLLAFNRQLLLEGDLDMRRPHYKKQALITELFAEDLKAMLPLPETDYDSGEIKAVRTDAYAKFSLEQGKHTYSTAPRYALSELLVKLTAFEVVVLDENYREIMRHPRLYGPKQEQMNWLPYLTQLSRRPMALKYSGIYTMLPEPVQLFFDRCDYQAKKEALKALSRISEESSFEKASAALSATLEHGATDFESIMATFSRLNSDYIALDALVLPKAVPALPSTVTKASLYDDLFLGGAHDH
jgi:transposase